MASRLENLDKISDFLRDRYVISVGVTKQIEEYERLGDFDKAEAIVRDPAYRDNSKFIYTVKELSQAIIGLDYQQIYYAMVSCEQRYVGKQEQPPKLVERGIHTNYLPGKNNNEYSYNPQLITATAMAQHRPEIVIQRSAVVIPTQSVATIPAIPPVASSPVVDTTSEPVETKTPTGPAFVENDKGQFVPAPVLTEREQKIIDKYDDSLDHMNTTLRDATERTLDRDDLFLVTSAIVNAFVDVTGLTVKDILTEENAAKSPVVDWIMHGD